MRAVLPIATGTYSHVMSFDITQYHELTVPKLSQRLLSPLPRQLAFPNAATDTRGPARALAHLTSARSVQPRLFFPRRVELGVCYGELAGPLQLHGIDQASRRISDLLTEAIVHIKVIVTGGIGFVIADVSTGCGAGRGSD